jgi:hypothetical protein
MPHSRSAYEGLVYGIPFGFFRLMFVLLTLINKRVNWLLLRSILVIGFHDGDNPKPEKKSTEKKELGDLNNYLYIDFEAEERDDSARLSCIQRFSGDVLASAILAIFFTIIYNALILSTVTVQANEKCPDFDAQCFGGDGSQSGGPFNCTRDRPAGLPSSSKTWWCVGWVYKEKNVK